MDTTGRSFHCSEWCISLLINWFWGHFLVEINEQTKKIAPLSSYLDHLLGQRAFVAKLKYILNVLQLTSSSDVFNAMAIPDLKVSKSWKFIQESWAIEQNVNRARWIRFVTIMAVLKTALSLLLDFSFSLNNFNSRGDRYKNMPCSFMISSSKGTKDVTNQHKNRNKWIIHNNWFNVRLVLTPPTQEQEDDNFNVRVLMWMMEKGEN